MNLTDLHSNIISYCSVRSSEFGVQCGILHLKIVWIGENIYSCFCFVKSMAGKIRSMN